MNTTLRQALIDLCSWIPGSRAVPAPRNDGMWGFLHQLWDARADLRSTNARGGHGTSAASQPRNRL